MLIVNVYLTEDQLADAKLEKSFQISAYQMKLNGNWLLEIFPYRKYSQLLRNLKNNKGFRFMEGQYKIIGNLIPIEAIKGVGLNNVSSSKPEIKRTARKVGKQIVPSGNEINLTLQELEDVEDNLKQYSNKRARKRKKQELQHLNNESADVAGDGIGQKKKVNTKSKKVGRNIDKTVSKEKIGDSTTTYRKPLPTDYSQPFTDGEIGKITSSGTKSRSRIPKGASNESLYTKIPKNLKVSSSKAIGYGIASGGSFMPV